MPFSSMSILMAMKISWYSQEEWPTPKDQKDTVIVITRTMGQANCDPSLILPWARPLSRVASSPRPMWIMTEISTCS